MKPTEPQAQETQLARVERAWLFEPNRRSYRLLMRVQWLLAASAALAAVTLGVTRTGQSSGSGLIPIALLTATAFAWNLGSALHLRTRQPAWRAYAAWRVQILAQIVALTWLLLSTGGATSPFVSLYLLPVALAAMALPLRESILLSLLAGASYAVLLLLALTSAPAHAGHGMAEHSSMSHTAGMAMSFSLAGALLLGAIWSLRSVAQRQQQDLAELREQALLDHQVIAIGGIAAGAAHSLATPLSTARIILDEARDSLTATSDDSALRGDLDIASDQLGLATQHLRSMLAAGQQSPETAVSVEEFTRSLAMNWRLTHPEVDLVVRNRTADIEAGLDPALQYCLTALLDNAARASLNAGDPTVELTVSSTDNGLTWQVADTGEGFEIDTQSADGHGVGLTIVESNAARLGGSLTFTRTQGKHAASLVWPAAVRTAASG